MESIRKQITELQKEVALLCSIQACEDFIDRMHIDTSGMEDVIQL